ncbi:MAG TPA: succinic semialdehyde dehydrogenase, partial [Thermoleophilaceae bacterium]|nr:succinic semialdehyde dehydrogenase [Thermoleophilaceae bacterium]
TSTAYPEAPQAQQAGPPSIEVQNPATGKTIASVPVTPPERVPELVRRARAAQPGWEALGFEGRARIFMRCQKWVTDNQDRIIDTIVSETGKTYEDALMAEVNYAAAAFGFWAKNAEDYLEDEKLKTSSPFVKGRKLVVRYAPLGVVGVIGPWNYPLTNSFGDCIPALAAGNAVILKPSEVTPLTSMLMGEMLRQCGLPADVYQVAPGHGDTGAALIDEVDFVMFTGSTATGKKIMERASHTLTPIALELGGKDPMLVLADADVERAANAAVHYSMQNAGQTCISTERVYVEEPIYDDFVRREEDKVRALRQSAPGAAGSTDVGAMTFTPQSDIVEAHVKDAVDKGARVLVGGHRRDDGGHFYEPTLLVDVDHSMTCMREETFGPTLPVMKVSDADEAVRLANDSEFGLQASVWTKDLAKGERLARQIEAGAVTVNDAQINYVALELPMGGWKASGLGSRHGADGIRKYTQKQTVLVTRYAMKKDLHMLPYSKGRTRLLSRMLQFVYGRGKRS